MSCGGSRSRHSSSGCWVSCSGSANRWLARAGVAGITGDRRRLDTQPHCFASRRDSPRPPAGDSHARDKDRTRDAAMTQTSEAGETRRTVLTAGAANIAVAVLKLIAGLFAGSSAMLAESAHSLADTLNQGLLLTSLRLGERPGDRRHPFGYGQDRYFWSLLSAFGIFIAGAGFSIFEGILALRQPETEGSPILAYA